jgi:hypothetical protein
MYPKYYHVTDYIKIIEMCSSCLDLGYSVLEIGVHFALTAQLHLEKPCFPSLAATVAGCCIVLYRSKGRGQRTGSDVVDGSWGEVVMRL